MGLEKAHEGYEYQDLLTAYFILKEIIEDNESSFIIDMKMYAEDKFDDLTIKNVSGILKRQIKYSNETSAHTLEKSDISADSSYDLAIDSLYSSWLNDPNKTITKYRLCLAWDEPIDELKPLLCSCSDEPTFPNFKTNVQKIEIDKLWPQGSSPLKSWKRLNKVSQNIDRTIFSQFCDKLIFELNFPKFSLNIYDPGQLEQIVLEHVNKIGIGLYPNNNWKPEEFVLSLLSLIKRSRSKHTEITTKQIFSEFQIKTDYGCIEQAFPVDQSKNIDLNIFRDYLLKNLSSEKKILLTGEPGCGKSWFVENLISYFVSNDIKVIHHYCYVDMADDLQKERIKLNVFYGNLISDILKAFPHLKEKKQSKFASNLSELNILLENLDEPTVLIIDGLDHIKRIFDFHSYPDISTNEIEIIEAISKLKCSDKLQIIITSQKVRDLRKISGFAEISMPGWTKSETLLLMQKHHIPDDLIEERLLSDILTEKSNGNPLYLNYLIEEIIKIPEPKLSHIQNLPDYSFNLSKYYDYLLTKLNESENVPRILSGVNFSLSKLELGEITGLGDYVNESLELISPVTKLNVSQNGYIIYHESFRRYIIDRLKSKDVSLETAIFNPIIEWFKKKDFYDYPKSYRYYLQFLFNCNRFDLIVDKITNTFVTESVFHGQSWELISKNYKYLAAAGIAVKDFPKIIIINELGKLIASTENSYNESFHLYFEALGHFRGFQSVLDYLSYEGKPTLSLKNGLEACYLCDSNGIQAPWDIYYEYFSGNEGVKIEDFRYYLRYHLVFRNIKEIIRIAHNVLDENLFDYEKELRKELNSFKNTAIMEEMNSEDPIISELIMKTCSQPELTDLKVLAKQISDCKNFFDKEIPLLISFFQQIKLQINDSELINELISTFRNINWFNNWIIYCIKISKLQSTATISSNAILEAFQELINDTEPFKGKPRTCDLHSIQGIIYSTINDGLSLVTNDSACWKKVIEKLVVLSDDTTTSLQKSLSGPLSTDKLFKILSENVNKDNIEHIISVFEKNIENKKEYHLHSYIAEYYFQLSKIYSITLNNEKAENTFRKGVEFMLGYTFRRDLTIEDLIESVVSLSVVDKKAGLDGIKKIKPLVDSVVDHTDGKDTKHFPVEWFSKYLEIDFAEASKYLCHELLHVRYDWRLEDSLIDLLKKYNGNVNPIIELAIAKTFINKISEEYLSYCIELSNKIQNFNPAIASDIISYVCANFIMKESKEYSADFINKLNDKCSEFKISNQNKSTKTNQKEDMQIDDTDQEEINIKNLDEMSLSELIDYIKNHKLKDSDLHSISNLFDDNSTLTVEIKELIKYVILKNNEFGRTIDINLDTLFPEKSEIFIYYLVARFVYEQSGWLENLVNADSLKKAISINKELSICYLTELLTDKIGIKFDRLVSANLINALVAAKYNPETTQKMWNNLFEMTDNRLPIKNICDWNQILLDELKMSIEEILICILFTRFKANTSERFHITLCAISSLLYSNPEKMIKPIKWFLKQNDKFLEVVLLTFLELLHEYNTVNPSYIDNFSLELKSIYPQRKYLTDYLLEKLLKLSSFVNFAKIPNISYPSDAGSNKFFMNINSRHSKIKNVGLDIENIFGKHRSTFAGKYKDKFDLYHNSLYSTMVKHIYAPNYLLDLINTDMYYELRNFYNQDDVFDSIKIQIKPLIAQHMSQKIRPETLKKPTDWNKNFTKNEIIESGEWIRIAHYETELNDKVHYKLDEITVYGGLTFTNQTSIFPFEGYRLFPEDIYSISIEDVRPEECIIVTNIQMYDPLEDYKILWLHPFIFSALKLTIDDFLNGLQAKNENGAIVLQYNSWCSDYLSGSGISDEIPKLDGAELIIRKDYYDKICSFFDEKPSYSIFKIEHSDSH